jgi:hypothetical protein
MLVIPLNIEVEKKIIIGKNAWPRRRGWAQGVADPPKLVLTDHFIDSYVNYGRNCFIKSAPAITRAAAAATSRG